MPSRDRCRRADVSATIRRPQLTAGKVLLTQSTQWQPKGLARGTIEMGSHL
jgi:hypothetical protein